MLGKTRNLSAGDIDRFVVNRANTQELSTFYSHNLKHECFSVPATHRRLSPLPLDLIERFQRDKNGERQIKKGYGQTPSIKYFGHKSGQKIRETGAIIDGFCGENVERCRVVTLTLPSSDVLAYKAISDYSGYAVNRLFQIIRRDYKLAYWFYVYEHQKRGALHLHICVYHNDPEISREIGEKLCAKWRDILQDISAKSSVNLLFSKGFNRECKLSEMQLDNQAMRLGCGAYFSKYASKNSGKYSDDINSINARKYPPSSFWGRSRELSKACERESFHFRFEGIDDCEGDDFEDEAHDIINSKRVTLKHDFAFKKEIRLDSKFGGGTLTICEGFSKVFYVHPDDYKDLLVHFRFLYKDSLSSNIPERSKVSQSFTHELVDVNYDSPF